MTQLCEACDINRGTFYLHYTDVYDLLSRIEEEMLTDFENVLGKLVPEEIVGQQSPALPCAACLSFWQTNADMCKSALVQQRRHGLCGKGQRESSKRAL